MRTRNADASKSPATKKTPPQKKIAAAAAGTEKLPETTPKSTPKSTPKATKAAKAKQSVSKPSTTPIASTLDPKPEVKAEETETLVEVTKPAPAVKSPQKKPAAKKSPLAAKASIPPKVDPEPEPVHEKEKEVKNEEDRKQEASDAKQEGSLDLIEEDPETNDVTNEEDEVPEVTNANSEDKPEPENNDAKDEEEQVMETDEMENGKDLDVEEPMELMDPEEKGSEEPGDDELVSTDDIGEGEGMGVEGQDYDQEGDEVEDEEQLEISDMAKARKIKKEKEIFIGGLNRDATEEDVKKEFEKVGEVVEVRILKDFVTNKNKGFAFVKYATKEQAAKALEELKNPMIRGKRCGIAPSEDNDTLFLGNICNTWTKEAVRQKLKDYGIGTFVNLTLVPDTQNEGLSRGFAFVEFPSHADAMVAYKRLQKPDVIFGHPERTAKVAFAVPLREPDPEVMAQVKSVFVDGLPPYWDEDRVKEQFKGYGEIERVVLARNMSTSKRNDFGFVNFMTHEAAIACIERVNNTELGDEGKPKTKARARLANPLPKAQAVKGGMSGGFRIGHSSIGDYPRFGRGFGRGRFPSHRAGFQGGRGFVPRGRGRGRAQFPFPAADFETSYSEFRGDWTPFGARGGRRISTSARRGGFERGRGRVFPSSSHPFPPEEDFNRPFGGRHLGEDPYFYDDGGQGLKRPFSMMEHDPYLDHGNRIRPRYHHPEPNPMTAGTRYRDPLGMTGLYSRNYYGSDYGGSSYSSYYGGESSGRGYYY